MIYIDTQKIGVAPGTTTIALGDPADQTEEAVDRLVRLQKNQLRLQILSTVAGVCVAAVGIWRLVSDRKKGSR